MELDLCFKLINDLLIRYTSFTNEIFGQLLSNYSCYAANLNMKAVSFFFTHPVSLAENQALGSMIQCVPKKGPPIEVKR